MRSNGKGEEFAIARQLRSKSWYVPGMLSIAYGAIKLQASWANDYHVSIYMAVGDGHMKLLRVIVKADFTQDRCITSTQHLEAVSGT